MNSNIREDRERDVELAHSSWVPWELEQRVSFRPNKASVERRIRKVKDRSRLDLRQERIGRLGV